MDRVGLALWSWCGEGGSRVEGECYESGMRNWEVGDAIYQTTMEEEPGEV